MKKQLLYFGILGGLINVLHWLIYDTLLGSGESDYGLGEILGYAAMLLALSTVFFGVKRYRDHALGGKITFKQAFLNGLIVVLVASSIYVIGWEIYYPNFAPDFGSEYSEYLMENYKAQGLSDENIQLKAKEMKVWMERYQNPLFRIPMTLLEILPLGILVTLVAAFALKKQ